MTSLTLRTLSLGAMLAASLSICACSTPKPTQTAMETPTSATAAQTPVETPTSATAATSASKSPTSRIAAFYIYRDVDYPKNHFTPSGFMGDVGDVELFEADTSKPYSGKTALRFRYSHKGAGPYSCDYDPPCKWAGVYWQDPPNNWGEVSGGAGYDLSDYSRLKFAARATTEVSVEFKVGGIIGTYGDSLEIPAATLADLTTRWKEFEIDLAEADLTHIIGGFVWALNWDAVSPGSSRPIEFYLDDIRFEQ